MIVPEGRSKLLTVLYCERTVWQAVVLQVVIWISQGLSQKLNSLIYQVILPQIQFYKLLFWRRAYDKNLHLGCTKLAEPVYPSL